MTKEEFKKAIEAVNEKFDAFWNAGQDLYPSQFPDEMGESDWLGQFIIYAEKHL